MRIAKLLITVVAFVAAGGGLIAGKAVDQAPQTASFPACPTLLSTLQRIFGRTH